MLNNKTSRIRLSVKVPWGGGAANSNAIRYFTLVRETVIQTSVRPFTNYSRYSCSQCYIVLHFIPPIPLQNQVLGGSYWDFPGGPVAKTLCSQCRGPRFNPWSGNWIPHAATKNLHATTKTQHSQINIF